MSVYEGPLGRLPAPDDRHLIRHSLTAGTMPKTPTPVTIGVWWYQAFDAPIEKNGAYWLPDTKQPWGRRRGGHCVCLKPPATSDLVEWWVFYNQLSEGACVGFGVSRMMTLLNRRRYDAPRVYHEALKIDEWPGEADEGTSVRAGCDVARLQGMWRVRDGESRGPIAKDGIDANRWAKSVEEVAACLDPDSNGRKVLRAGYVTLLNSWGQGYPHYVRVPLDTLEYLVFTENGDATVVTDR